MMQIREGCVEQKLTTSDKTCHLRSKYKVESRYLTYVCRRLTKIADVNLRTICEASREVTSS